MKVQVLDDAIADLVSGYHFYQRQAQGLGDQFLETLWSDIRSLTLYGGIHSKHLTYYRLLSKRFPFAIYYKVEHGIVKVHAVMDCRKNPGSVTKRLT